MILMILIWDLIWMKVVSLNRSINRKLKFSNHHQMIWILILMNLIQIILLDKIKNRKNNNINNNNNINLIKIKIWEILISQQWMKTLLLKNTIDKNNNKMKTLKMLQMIQILEEEMKTWE